jgi:apolipoprotein N-acyltransferase
VIALAVILLTAVLTAGAFPPFNQGYLAFAALVPLMLYTRGAAGRKALLVSWLGGWAASTAVVWWVVNTIIHYGGISTGLAVPILLLLTWAMGAFWGVFFSVRRRLSTRWPLLPDLVAAPVLWTALEFVRGHLPELAFPWALLGASQHLHLPLIQSADIFGIWGISFFVVMVNSALASLLTPAPQGRLPRLLPAAVTAGAAALMIVYGTGRLAEEPNDGTIRVSVLQGNVDQDEKWREGNKLKTYELYEEMTRRAAAEGADLVVWPETALPLIYEREPYYQSRIADLARSTATPVFFGTPGVHRRADGRNSLRNRAYLVDGEGTVRGHYDKMHLVPFGEYVPWQKVLFFVSKLTSMTGEFTAGTEATVFPVGGESFGSLICYEVVFPELARLPVLDGATFLVNITNDAWFGRTAASEQHFATLVFRAVENRRPLARAANTGISGFVDSRGRILEASAIFVKGRYTADIETSTEMTLYTRRGDWLPLSCLLASLLLLATTLTRHKARRYKL